MPAGIKKPGVTVRGTVTDKRTGEVVKEIQRSGSTVALVPGPGKAIAWVHAMVPIKITKKFQGIGVEVGCDFPFEVTPGDVKVIPDLIREVAAQVNEVVPEFCAELQESLDALVKAVGRK